LLWVATP